MEGMGEDGLGTTKNRRHRTLRQQMLNKQAQQRYRCGAASLPPMRRPTACICCLRGPVTCRHRSHLPDRWHSRLRDATRLTVCIVSEPIHATPGKLPKQAPLFQSLRTIKAKVSKLAEAIKLPPGL